MQQELESLKATLDGQKEEQNNMMAMLEQQRAEAVDVQYTLEEEQKVIEGQDAAIQKAIELEQQRQAELKRQQEEEVTKTKDSRRRSCKTRSSKWLPQRHLVPRLVHSNIPVQYVLHSTESSQSMQYCTCFIEQLYSSNTRCCYIWFWLSNPPCVWY